MKKKTCQKNEEDLALAFNNVKNNVA